MVINGEPFRIIADELIDYSHRFGAKYCNPTPLVSPFWGSTFTPSSTEVYARDIASGIDSNIVTTIQPCIRFIDFGSIGNDYHSLFFNMWSCFFKDALDDLEGNVEKIICAIEKVIGINRNEWRAIYHLSNSKEQNVNQEFIKLFGEELLDRIGLNKSHCHPVYGSLTYLHQSNGMQAKSTHLTGTPAEQVEGPRIELFAELPNGDFVEIATVILFSGTINLPDKSSINIAPSLAVAAGIERLALLRFKKNTLFDIGIYNSVFSLIQKELSTNIIPLIRRELMRLSSLIVAEIAIQMLAPDIPERSNFGPNKEKRRIKKEIVRLSSEMGISSEVIDDIGNKCFAFMEEGGGHVRIKER